MKLLATVSLTDNQKRVIAKIIAAPTPMVAGQQISKGENLVAARNMLMKLGLITFLNNQAEVTEKGKKIAMDLDVLDDGGNLTDTGQKLAASQSSGQPEPEAADAPPAGGDMGMGADSIGMDDPSTMPPAGGEDDLGMEQPGAPKVKPPMEGFALLKQLLA